MSIPLALARRAVANFALRRPYCASFELTYNCNARCQHCHRGPQVPNEQLATPERLLEICKEIRPIVAIMSGGEPLIRRELDEIVRLFKKGVRPIRVFLNTNGSLLTTKRFRELKKAGVDELLISFDYPDARHDEWRAIPGLFGKIEGFVGGLSPEDRSRVVLTSVFQSKNFREAPRMAEVALAWGVNINFSAYTWLRTNDMELMISADEIDDFRDVVAHLLEMKAEHGHILTSDWILNGMAGYFLGEAKAVCRAGERSLVVNPDGTFSPCGLLIRDYPTHRALVNDFTRTNTCISCYTSTRANSERPAKHVFLDHLPYLRRSVH
jgi:MoaA/NifB/PqqE/SkfB family radical SAM enzyme